MSSDAKIINKDELPEMMKVSEVAAFLRISIREAYDLLPRLEGFPIIKLSERRTRIPRDAFLNWLEEYKKASA